MAAPNPSQSEHSAGDRNPEDNLIARDGDEVIESNWNEVAETFADMGLKDGLLRGVYADGFEKPSAIQERAIMPCVNGHDGSVFLSTHTRAENHHKTFELEERILLELEQDLKQISMARSDKIREIHEAEMALQPKRAEYHRKLREAKRGHDIYAAVHGPAFVLMVQDEAVFNAHQAMANQYLKRNAVPAPPIPPTPITGAAVDTPSASDSDDASEKQLNDLEARDADDDDDVDEFFKQVEEIRTSVETVKTDVESVKHKHSAILSAPTTDDRHPKDLDQLIAETDKTANKARSKFAGIETSLEQEEQWNKALMISKQGRLRGRIKRQLEIAGRATRSQSVEDVTSQERTETQMRRITADSLAQFMQTGSMNDGRIF